jgi:cell division protein FtsB
MSSGRRAEAMIDARRRDSAAKRDRVLATVERMLADGTPITVAAVARTAGVSTWLTYTPGVRDAVAEARSRQLRTPDGAQGHDPAAAGLRTDLALARAEITRLRGERDQQHQQLRLALGARLDNLAKADLLTRLDELTTTNTGLAATADQLRTDNHALHKRVAELEDDLAAARTSLRRMIRAENTPSPTSSG